MAVAKAFPSRGDLASLSRDTKLLYLFTFAFGVVGGLYFLVLPFYLLEAGYDATSIGLVNSVAGVALTLLTIPAGLLADAYGRKRSIIMGSLLVILTQLVLSISSDFFVVALAVLIGGIGVAFIFSSSGALMAGTLPKERMELGFSIQFFVSNIAFSTGAALGWLPQLLSSFGVDRLASFRLTILSGAFSMILAVIPILMVREIRKTERRAIRFRLESRNVILKFMAVNVFIGFGAGLTIPLFPVYYAKKFGAESGSMGTLQAVANITGAIAYLAAPQITKKLGTVNVVVLATTASIPLLTLIPLAPGFLLSTPLFVARQSLINMGAPLIESILMKIVKPEERATAAGISSVFWNLPNSFSQPLGGYMMDRISVDLPPFTTSIFYTGYTFLFFKLFRGADTRST